MKNLILVITTFLFLVSCSKDSDPEAPSQTASFTYTISGAASKTVTGDNANFGPTGSFDQTFISLRAESDELDIRIVLDPIATGSFEVNPMVVMDGGGQIVNIPIETRDSWADLGIGSTLAGDRRSFSTASANGGSVTITKVDGNRLEGRFNMSLGELLSGSDPFNNPKIDIQGSFVAIKQ